MKVHELIAKLQAMDPELGVVMSQTKQPIRPVTDVRKGFILVRPGAPNNKVVFLLDKPYNDGPDVSTDGP